MEVVLKSTQKIGDSLNGLAYAKASLKPAMSWDVAFDKFIF
jgi:hypothetical protein